MNLLFSLIFSTVLSFLFHIIMHEIGHFIAGLLTGWRLVHIQIFCFVFTKNTHNTSFQIKKINSISCQCIMYPKSNMSDSSCYTLGGICMNAMLALIFLYELNTLPMVGVRWIFTFCFFSCGISVFLMNAVPNTKKICNDMACYLLCKKEKYTHYIHNVQLTVAKQLSKGLSYRNCETPVLKENIEANDILAYQVILEFYYYLDCDLYYRAKSTLEKIDRDRHISRGVYKIIMLETLYYDLFMDILNKTILVLNRNPFYRDLDSYIQKYETAGDIHSERVKAIRKAYQFYRNGDIQGGVQSLDEAIAGMRKMGALYAGEKIFCLDQLEGIRNILRRDLLMTKL